MLLNVRKGAARLCALLVLLSGLISTHGQQYLFHPYRQAEGLSNLSITSLAFDRQGFLWVTTQNGVFRFLGTDLESFGPDRGILEQQADQVFVNTDGSIWVGTARTLYHWNGERFVPATSTPLGLNNDHSIASESSGTLLVVSNGHLLRLTYNASGAITSSTPVIPGASLAADPALGSIGIVASAPDGTLWVSCQSELCSLPPSGAQQVRFQHWGAAQGVPGEHISALLATPAGALWATTQHHVVELPPGASRFVDRTPPSLDSNRMYDSLPLALDSQGRVLVSAADGLARWNGQDWQLIGPNNGLLSTHITALAFDPAGELWLGSTGHGLSHWVGYNGWDAFTDLQGLPSANIWSVGLFDHDLAYIGTEKGPATIDLHTNAVTPFFAPGVWTYGHVKGMVQDARGNLWIGSQAGDLLKIDARSHHITHIAKLSGYIYDLTADAAGDVYLCNETGVYRVRPAAPHPTVELVPEAAALLHEPRRVYASHPSRDRSTNWFIARRGLLRLSNGAWSMPAIQGVPANAHPFRYFSASPVDDSLWVSASQDELWHLTPAGGHLQATAVPIPAEFHTLSFLGLLADSRGWLWLGTDDGMLLWNTHTWQHITQDSGLIWNDINGGRLAEAPDHSVWIGTSAGLSHAAHPERLLQSPALMLALLSVRRGATHLPLANGNRIPYAGGDLSFIFAVPAAVNRNDLTFLFRLSGIQDDWVQTHDTTAHFSSLRAGDYTFQVFARNAATGAVSSTIDYNFTVLPPWWQSSWMIALYVLLAAVLPALFYFWRVNHLLHQRLQLEALVQERTAELEASQAELRQLATRDGLTGLLNRTAVLDALDHLLARCSRSDFTLTVILVDLDHFKRLNDTFGHLFGDEALRCFSAVLTQSIRPYDIAGRYGGEEFLVLLTGVTPCQVHERLHALHASLSNIPCHHAGHSFALQCSMGAVTVPPFAAGIKQQHVLAEADRALYAAKHSGRNRLIYTPNPTYPTLTAR
jgi:diguanylate cyclase (GGDEF)-like protein